MNQLTSNGKFLRKSSKFPAVQIATGNSDDIRKNFPLLLQQREFRVKIVQISRSSLRTLVYPLQALTKPAKGKETTYTKHKVEYFITKNYFRDDNNQFKWI